jgi:hypothetical protein
MKAKIFRVLGFLIGFALILVAMINGWEEWRRGAFSLLYLLNACAIGSIFVIYGLFGGKKTRKEASNVKDDNNDQGGQFPR